MRGHLPIARLDEITRWMERGLVYLDAATDPRAHALAHLLLGVGRLDVGSFGEVEMHLAEVMRLATENNLAELASHSLFVLGNSLAERGDLAGACRAFRDSIAFAQAAGDEYQEWAARLRASGLRP